MSPRLNPWGLSQSAAINQPTNTDESRVGGMGKRVLTAGAIVVLLEKEKGFGGNSAKATSGINGIQTKAQVKEKKKE